MINMGNVPDFRSDLLYSTDEDISNRLNELYRTHIPNLLDILPTDNTTANPFQLNGIDKVVLTTGGLIGIEEKIRREVYFDILLEYISNDRKSILDEKRKGWIEKPLMCTWLAYYIQPIDKLFIFDWHELQSAWFNNREKWLGIYKPRLSDNVFYKSHNLPIPESELLPLTPSVIITPSGSIADTFNAIEEEERLVRLAYFEKIRQDYLKSKSND